MRDPLRGGCACGAVRFEIDALHDAGYCHCTICQRFSGAPAVAWANAEGRCFRLLQGSPRGFRSSEHWVRYFCPDCGAPVYQRHREPPDDGTDLLCVLIPSLDEPAAVTPRAHIWCSSRLPYFDVRDDLPRFEDGRLPAPGSPPTTPSPATPPGSSRRGEP